MHDKHDAGSTMRRRWLAVAYAFPPIGRSGTHRTLGFVQALSRLGWDATVLTAQPDGEPTDTKLLTYIPAGTHVVRTKWTDPIMIAKRILGVHAWRQWRRGSQPRISTLGSSNACATTVKRRRSLGDWLSRMLTTPDTRIGWIGPAYRAGMRAIRQHRPDVLYGSAPYYSALIITYLLSRRTGIPFVADLRDPWHDNPFRSLPYTSQKWWDAALERRILTAAAHVVCNTPAMSNALCDRLKSVASTCTTIPNGFDAQRFVDIEPVRPEGTHDRCLLLHAGQFYGPRSPLPLLAGLRAALRTEPKITLALVGPNTFDGASLHDLANQMGVGDHVLVLGPRTHDEALSLMAGADGLILAGATGSTTALQVPNKLYEYLALRRPIIASVPGTSPALDILEDAHAVYLQTDPADKRGIGQAFVAVAQRTCHVPTGAWSGVDRYSRATRAAELVDVFGRVLSPDAAREAATRACRREGTDSFPAHA